MNFVKMHGLGNDFIVLSALGGRQRIHLTPVFIRKLCHRRFGIGADGVILIKSSPREDFIMRIFNADGSEAEMCGNGIRCLGKYVYEHGLTRKTQIRVETKAGNKKLELTVKGKQVTAIRVAMGRPTGIADCELRIADISLKATRVSLGNPHCVVFTQNIDKFSVEEYGPIIEKHPIFPERTNVEFVRVINRKFIEQRTWERGVGETMACGTGACAAVVAGVFNKILNRRVTVHLKGGKLLVDYTLTGEVYLTGPAEEVFSGSI